MVFSIGDIVTPALMTSLLARGAVATWTPVLASVDMLGILLLARRLPAMRRRAGRSSRVSADASRFIEADSL